MSAPAYRSDLPLANAWWIDPVNGNDSAAGTSPAGALKSLHGPRGLKVRWWNAEITSNITVNVIGPIPPTDVGAWNVKISPGVAVMFIGSLGPTTGGAGAAIDNTLYSGSVTGFVAASLAPAADDIELTDTAIPVSYTASGLMADGVIFKRTNSTNLNWWALKDLGAKTLRMSPPMNNLGVGMNAALTVADTYTAYALWTIPSQFWGSEASRVVYDTLFDNGATVENRPGFGVQRKRCWINGARGVIAHEAGPNSVTNCMISGGSNPSLSCVATPNAGCQGLAFKSGVIVQGAWFFSGAVVGQGSQLQTGVRADVQIEFGCALHDNVGQAMLNVRDHSCLIFTGFSSAATTGISGKGNTGKIITVSDDSWVSWSDGVTTPPFVAGSSSDGSPIQINSTSYAVSAFPAAQNVQLCPVSRFPFSVSFTTPATGGVAVTINNAPVGSPAAPARYIKIPDGAGGFFTFPSLT